MATLLARRDGPVLLLTLDRPEVRNALSRALRAELADALDAAAADPKVRAVVMTGAGAAFCAGLDLDELLAEAAGAESAGAAEAALEDSRSLAGLYRQLIALPKPVIAAVNGAAVAGGAGLVNASDLAVAAASARLGYTEARIGFVPAIVATLLRTQMGEKALRELLLGAELIGARRALELGLVNEVVPDGQAVARALELAGELARNAPGSLAATKALLLATSGLALDAALATASEANAARRSSDELAEGIRAFLDKRAPAWREPS